MPARVWTSQNTGPDFTGCFCFDAVIHAPQGPKALAEARTLLPIEDNMVSPSGGQTTVGFLQDSRLVLFEIVSKRTHFFTRGEAQSHFANVLLASEAAGSSDGLSLTCFPEPAVLKYPGSECHVGENRVTKPVWTGQQLVSALLPDGFQYESKEDGLGLTGGEFVEIDREGRVSVLETRPVMGSAWLGFAPGGLVAALNRQ